MGEMYPSNGKSDGVAAAKNVIIDRSIESHKMDGETWSNKIEKNTFGKSVGAEERIISKSFFEQEGDDEKLTVSSK